MKKYFYTFQMKLLMLLLLSGFFSWKILSNFLSKKLGHEIAGKKQEGMVLFV